MKKLCSHCHLEYDENALFEADIKGKAEFFCCKGCEGIFRILQESNLEIFYDKLGNNKLSPPQNYSDDLNKFDNEVFLKKYIKKLDENINEVSLIITKIHCIACVWLNQKVLNNTNGILKIDINYTNNKAKIIYDKTKIKLSEIIQKIRSIGYDAMIYDPKMIEAINAKERKEYYTKMIVGIFCTMNIMWIAVAQYLGYFLGMDLNVKNILNTAAFILATPTLFYCGFVFFKSGYYGLKNGFVNMDLLVAFGATLTYVYSIYAALSHTGETYFESVTMIITFILIGKFLEVKSRKNAGDSIDRLSAEIPNVVNILKNDKVLRISPEEVQKGDIIQVAPGEKIAIDGILLSKVALLDSSMLTGESAFVDKKIGDEIISGSINMDYNISYKATKIFNDSTMYNIINLIQDSINKKPEIENKANAISYNFSLFVIFVAIGTFIFWAFSSNIQNAIVISVSVVIIACPCALALATPISSVVGISEAYKNKLLFKEAKFLETMAKMNAIVFDKTGTLTFGKPKVINLKVFEEFNYDVLSSFLKLNNHPVSIGVGEFLKSKNKIIIEDFRELSQNGIKAKYNNHILLGGSKKFMEKNNIFCEYMQDSNMNFYYAVDNKLKAVFALEDKLKDNAKEIVQSFLNNNFRVVILSGDRLEVVKKVAQSLGIEEYYFEQTPQHKSDFIDKLHNEGYKNIMVGDGINDAIALNKSDIAISMGQGSDVAMNSSDIILLDDSLESLLKSYNISKKTYKIIKQNIRLSIIYNLITIPLASFGFIIPLFAALSMSFSSFIVILNSLRIKIK